MTTIRTHIWCIGCALACVVISWMAGIGGPIAYGRVVMSPNQSNASFLYLFGFGRDIIWYNPMIHHTIGQLHEPSFFERALYLLPARSILPAEQTGTEWNFRESQGWPFPCAWGGLDGHGNEHGYYIYKTGPSTTTIAISGPSPLPMSTLSADLQRLGPATQTWKLTLPLPLDRVCINPHWPGIILTSCCGYALTPLLVITFGECRSNWRRNRGRCTACGYSLRGLTGAVCPECGKAGSTLNNSNLPTAGMLTPASTSESEPANPDNK
jgi:hypothetical protein